MARFMFARKNSISGRTPPVAWKSFIALKYSVLFLGSIVIGGRPAEIVGMDAIKRPTLPLPS